MSAERFTPGPWDSRQEYGELRDEIGVHGKAVATVWVRKRDGVLKSEQEVLPDPEGEANARLIVAAPDMYAALKDAREFVVELLATRKAAYFGRSNDAYVQVIRACIEQIDAALAKAEGNL